MNLLQNIKTKLLISWQRFTHLSPPKKSVIILLILITGYFSYTTFLTSRTQQPLYQTATVEKGTLITSITASGTMASGGSSEITSSATGIVNTVYVNSGDMVTTGQKIAEITPDQNSAQKQAAAYASYLGAQNSLNAAKAKMNSLQSALFKANQTFVTGAGTADPDTDDPRYIEQRADWLQAEADYTNQQNVIAQAQASLTSSWLSYAQTSSTITAPTSGTISNLTLTPGMSLLSSNSTSDTTTSSSYGNITTANQQLQASFNLSEIDVTKIKIGQKATITLDAYPDKTFTGKVTTINTNGTVSSNVTTYPATITFDTADNTIYPNMAVSAQIITDIKDTVLLVPSSAITGTGDSATVRVLKNGKAQQVLVVTGSSNDTQTEITSGLNEGDTVITSTTPTTTGTSTTTSPFGGSGFGGARSLTGGTGGNRVFVQTR